MNRARKLTALAIGALAVAVAIPEQNQARGCGAPPISSDALNAAISRPVTRFAENVVHRNTEPVEADTANAMLDLLQEVDDCANAGEPLRVWPLYSAGYLARLFQIQGPFDEATYAAYAEPRPGGTGRGVRIESIDAIWNVRDGLYAIEVVKTYPSVPMPKRLIFWIVESEGRYLVEEITGEISYSLP